MKQIKVIIERSRDAFSAYAENAEGISGMGDTVQEVKESLLESIEIQKELGNLKVNQFEIVYKFDMESLLHYYKGIFSQAAFERMTGINQHQISHYANGTKKPRPAQAKKIETALHQLGEELLAVEL
ncbi:MAG: XRE family transcriptional regulator [Chitinophagaceae bacterium]|nr:MAG: XRE family transcriptional regulator [Chitinophagaceae bacterium]